MYTAIISIITTIDQRRINTSSVEVQFMFTDDDDDDNDKDKKQQNLGIIKCKFSIMKSTATQN